jgi:hypothetical protein
MKKYLGTGNIIPPILYLGTILRWAVIFTFQAFPPGKDHPYPRYSLDRRVGGPRTGLDAVARRKHSTPCYCRNGIPSIQTAA